MIVRLTQPELMFAAMVGIARHIDARMRGRREAYGAERIDGWGIDIEGACGEAAFAKALNHWWSGTVGEVTASDVGDTEIRTAKDHNRKLILHPRDADDRYFVFITGVAPEFHIRGWIQARDGKRPEYWSDPVGGRPAFFVPVEALNAFPMRGG